MQGQPKTLIGGPMLSNPELDQYRRLGHTGYVLAYRERHSGDDPTPSNLKGLADHAEPRRVGMVVKALKAVIDFLT